MLLRARRRHRLVRPPDVNWLVHARARKSPYHTSSQALFREFPSTASANPPPHSTEWRRFFPGYGQNLILLSLKKYLYAKK